MAEKVKKRKWPTGQSPEKAENGGKGPIRFATNPPIIRCLYQGSGRVCFNKGFFTAKQVKWAPEWFMQKRK